MDRNVTFSEENGQYYFELYDDVTVEVTFEKDVIENPETSDNVFVMYSLLILCIVLVILARRLFMRYGAKFE